MQNSGAALTLVAAAAQNLPVSMTCQNSTPTTVVISQVQTGATNTSQYINSGSSPQVSNMSAQQLQEAEAALESDKRSIYKHPLFPLMALLFEKCEQATQTPDCPSSDGFDVDIQAFVHHQEQDRKPFFSDNPELDNLMVKSIQVLRIHLLELEKVNDLCKDFCSRYITCLKGKLQSENLLRTDMQDMSGSPTLLSSPTQAVQQMQQVLTSVGQGGMVIQNMAQPAMATLNQGQIVSGGTVYQMVQTPQGLVAQPIQIQAQNPLQSGAATTTPVIHGTTPLSQIGVVSTPTNASQTTTVSSSSLPMTPNSPGSDDEGRKNKRGVLPKQATQVMRSWLFQHIVHPYPTEDEKRQIAAQTNLSLLQVNNWFINARRRILQPMLDASNPDLSKVKKNKPQTRPVQRFWPDSIANIQPQPVTSTSQLPTSDVPQQQQPQQSQPQATTVSVSSSQVTVTPQQIIIPAGRIVTADGQIINTTTATTVSIQSLPNDIGGLTPMLQQLQQQQQQQGTPSPGGTLHIKSEGNLSISEEDLGLNHSDEDDDSDLSD